MLPADNLEDLLSRLPKTRTARDFERDPQRGEACLPSGVPTLDRLLEGGLPWGGLIEWGVPSGRAGREVVLRFLAQATSQEPPLWCLWLQADPQLIVYPPAWQARGIRLEHMRFAQSAAPLVEMKPVFLDPFFRCIVIDAPKSCNEEECAFLARQARAQNQIIILTRHFFLTPRQGNVWARLRLNSWQDPASERFCVHVLRGLSERQMSFEKDQLVPTFTGCEDEAEHE